MWGRVTYDTRFDRWLTEHDVRLVAHKQARNVFEPDSAVLDEIDVVPMLRASDLLIDSPELLIDTQR